MKGCNSMRKVFPLLFILILSVTLLGACNSSSNLSEASEIDTSTLYRDILSPFYPEGVLDGTISPKYYEEVASFLGEQTSRSEDTLNFVRVIVEKKHTERTIDEFREFLFEYRKLLYSFHGSPKTEADKEIDALLRRVIEKEKETNKMFLNYVSTGERKTLKDALEHIDTWIPDAAKLAETTKKHKIYFE